MLSDVGICIHAIDIMYIPIREGWLYLVNVMDVFGCHVL